jgi:tetratricopeptide (TPR) repeat protein
LENPLDQNIDRRLKELVRLSLDKAEFRAAMVVNLLQGGLYEQALEHSLPLVGTPHSPWFLYARAWHYVSQGKTQEGIQLLSEAFLGLRPERREGLARPSGFSFNENGKPRLLPPFNTPLSYSYASAAKWPHSSETLGYPEAIVDEDWLNLLSDINSNIREYKKVFRGLSQCAERVLHHDVETVRAAVATAEFDDQPNLQHNYFLLLSLLSEDQLRLVAETLWRVTADWGHPIYLCEVVSFFFYLLDEDEVALKLSTRGVEIDPASVVCGNIRALIFNRTDRPHLADEQWRTTLELNPERSATYLVLGHQALCAGGFEPAMRYFQEATVIGDNPLEADRFLTAALECVDSED